MIFPTTATSSAGLNPNQIEPNTTMITLHEDNETTTYTVDIDGEQGNAFYLLGLCKTIAKAEGVDHSPIIAEMMSGDYTHLVKTLDHHFHDQLTIVTNQSDIIALIQ